MRLQFGPRVIELGELQVCIDTDGRNVWARMRMFGAILGLGAGCNSDGLVQELEQWIDAIESQCEKSTSLWRIEIGSGSLGFEPYPTHLDE